jgi:molybdenum cofactor cytidylyltransferase
MNRHEEKVAGIILSAGASTRMGTPKQLLPIEGGTILGRVLNEALNSDLDKVIVVLCHKAKDIMEVLGQILTHPKLKVIENKHYKDGISTSIIAGLSQVEDIYGHVMILLGDMPSITSHLINLLVREFLASHHPIGAINLKGKRSHPVIFSRTLYHELHALRGDVGAKALFQKYRDKVCLVEIEESYDNKDIDTREDYLEFKDRRPPK